jgi:hypothetical protein
MKKKEYLTPGVQVIETGKMALLAGSGIISNLDTGFGGLDEGGSLDPDAPELLDVSSGLNELEIEL